jgi:intron-binding protein aquarius
MELLTDLIAQLPTRRFFRRVLMNGVHMSVVCHLSPVVRAHSHLNIEDQLKSKWCLFSKLLARFCFYERFEIDDFTGEALSELRMTELHCDRLRFLQRVCYQHMGDNLRDLRYRLTRAFVMCVCVCVCVK